MSFRLVITAVRSFLGRLLRLPSYGKTLLDRDVMIAVGLRYGRIICRSSAPLFAQTPGEDTRALLLK